MIEDFRLRIKAAVGEPSDLSEWRTRALYFVLWVMIVLGLPAYILPVLNAIQASQTTPLLWVYLFVYLAVVALAITPRLDFRLRGWGFLLLVYTNAVASFARLGMVGSGRLYLITLPVIATLLFGLRAGYLTTALGLIIYAVFTALASSGVLENWLAVQTNPVDLGYWLEAGAALLVFMALLMLLLDRFYRLQMRTLEANKQAVHDIHRQNEYMAALHETALGVVAQLDQTKLMETIVERAVSLADASYGFVYLETPERDAIEVKVGTGLYHKYVGQRLKRGEGLSGRIWQIGQPVLVEDYNTWEGRSPRFTGDPVGPSLGAPLYAGTEVVGVIGLVRAPKEPVFRPDELDLITRFAQLASIALVNSRLHTFLQEELAERERSDRALQERLDFEKLITNISTEFINLGPDEFDSGIQHALQRIGEFSGDDRSYVFVFSGDGILMDNTHEWCAPGIEPQIQNLQAQPLKSLGWCTDRIKLLEVVQIRRVADLPPEAWVDRDQMLGQDIQSLILVPMVYRGEAIGFLGFDSVRKEKTWSEDSVTLLKIVGEIFVNALEHKRSQAIQAGQRKFLELLAKGGDFYETLHALVSLIEEQWPGMLGLVLLLDEDGKHLHIGASTSLPLDYLREIEGLEIGPLVGSCGTACYTGQRVIVEDIQTDPRWDGLRNLAVEYDLRACWSEPVISEEGRVVGTFAMYYRQPRAPTKAELHAIETAAHLVGVAVEHRRVEEALRNSELRFRAVFEGAPIGISITSLEGRLVDTNHALQQMYGFTGEEFHNLSVFDYTYPEDIAQDMDLFFNQLVTGKIDQYQLEKRYIRKNGQVFWGRLSLSLARSEEGQPLFAIATTEDITQQKDAAEQLALAYQTLEQRVQERTRELAVVNAIAAVVSRSLDLTEILKDSLEKTMEVTGIECGTAYRLDNDGQNLVSIAHQGLSDDFIRKVNQLSLEAALAGKTIQKDKPLIYQVSTDYPEDELKETLQREGLQVIIGVPLAAKGQLLGAMILSMRSPRSFSPEEQSLLVSIGQQVAVAVENARLYDQVQQTALLEERARLSRELHDSVTQSIYSVTLYAEAAARLLVSGDSQAATDYLRELRDTAQEALREMRLLIYELRPVALEKSGLASALQMRLESVEGRAGLHAELRVEGEESVPFAVKEELYHIAQEALNNILKHSRAKRVLVTLHFRDEAVAMEICDDGVGFDPADVLGRGGFGLSGMKERAQRIGGNLQVESTPGRGTKVRIDVRI